MKNFEVCVRGMIKRGNKILVCYHKKENIYFFPGGHINFGESVKEAILREFKEELGISVKKFSLIGVMENVYVFKRIKHHEFNLVFEIRPKKLKLKSREEHIDFFWFDLERFKKEKVLPIALQKAILKWQKDKKFFWASQIYEKTIKN
jgi:8-oxo-dGTP pyrophosphatase MutT (NUDIX family)